MNTGDEFTILTSSFGWNALFGLGSSVSVFVTLPISFIAFFFFLLFPLYFALNFMERKLAADLQARVGPNRTPGNGALQILADTLKLGSKSNGRMDSSLNPRWFAVQNAFLYSSFVFLPFGTALVFVDSEVGAFLPFISLAGVFLCALFTSEGGTDLETEITAHRQTFLWISAWVSALVATTISVAWAGSGRWSTILSSQSHGIFSWVALSSPFGFVAFFVFLLSGLVALQLPPFHALDRGVRRRSGSWLGLFNLNQFYATYIWCLLASGLFLGGQAVIQDPADLSFTIAAFQLISALTKAGIIYIIIRVVTRALPQLRQDQMSELCWRVLTPVGALCLVGELAWMRVFHGGGN